MVSNKYLLSGILAGLILVFGIVSIGISPVDSNDHMNEEHQRSIVEIASDNDQFSTLVKAIKAADLAETLQKDGPFTVFAPTNDAFDELEDGTLGELLEPDNKAQLRNLLQYHVLSGRITYGGVMGIEGVHGSGGSMVETLSGDNLTIDVIGETVKVNDATVIKPDIEAKNGVIHVIDGVLNPSSTRSAMSPRQAKNMIDDTIEEGAPMYNNGHHGETAKLYMDSSMTILNQSGDEMPEGAMDALRHATGLAKQMHDDSERAWVLRYGMDAAVRQMEGSMSGSMSQ